MASRWVWARRAGVAAVVAGGVLVVGLGVGWLWLRSAPGNRFVARQVDGAVDGLLLEGAFDLGSLRTNAWNEVEVTGVALRDATGRVVVGLDRATVRINLVPLLRREARVRLIDVDGLVLDLRADDAGNDFTKLFGSSDGPSAPWSGLPIDVTVAVVRLANGEIRYTQGDRVVVDLGDVSLGASASVVGKQVSVRDIGLRATVRAPTEGAIAVRGGVGWDGDALSLDDVLIDALGSRLSASGDVTGLSGDPVLDLRVGFGPLDLAGIDAFAGIGLSGVFAGSLDAKGPLSGIRVVGGLDGRHSEGGLDVDATVNASGGLQWTGSLIARRLHVDDILPDKVRGKIPNQEPQLIVDGSLVVSGGGTKWPDEVWAKGKFSGSTQDIYGILLGALEADLALERGVLRIEPARAVGPLGDLEIRGSLDLARGPTDLSVGGTFDPKELARFGARDLDGRGTADLRVVGDLLASGVAWRVSGGIGIDAFRYGSDVSFSRIDAKLRVVAGETVRVTGSASGTTGAAYGVTVAGFEETALDVAVHPSGEVTIAGNVAATAIAMPDTLAVAEAAGPWSVRVTPDGRAFVEVDVAVGETEAVGMLRSTGGTARATVSPEAVDFTVALEDTLDTTGRFVLKDSALTLDTLSLTPVPGRTWTADRPLALRLVDGGIADADVALSSGVQRLAFTGDAGAVGPLDGALSVVGLDLGLIAELFPAQAGHVSGVADLTAELSGDAADFRVSGSLAATGRFIPDVTEPLTVAGVFHSDDAGDLFADLRVSTDAGRLLRARGTVPIVNDLAAPGLETAGNVDFTVDIAPGPVSRFAALTTANWPDASLSATLRASGKLSDPDLLINGLVEAPVDGWSAPARVEISAIRREGDLVFWADVLEGASRRGSLDGSGTTSLGEVIAWALDAGPEPDFGDYDLFLRDMVVDVELLDAPWSSLTALLGTDAEVEGNIRGTVQVFGSASRPEVAAAVSWDQTRVGGVDMTDGSLTLVPHRDAVGVDMRATFEGEGDLLVSGIIPLEIDLRNDWSTWFPDDMSLFLEGQGVPLAALSAFIPGMVDASGLAVMSGTVGGRPTDPRPDLDLVITGGSFSYTATGVRYEGIEAGLHATTEGVQVRELTLRTRPIGRSLTLDTRDEPSISFTGSMVLDQWAPTDLLGEVVLDRALVSWLPDMKVRLSGKTDVSGTWPDVVVRGKVRVDEAVIDRDEASFLEAGPLELSPMIRIHRGQPMERPVAKEEEPGLLAGFDIDVAVDLGRNVQIAVAFPFLDDLGQLGASITRADVTARVGGEVRFAMRGGTPEIYGDVDVVEGKVRVMRSNFELKDGAVVFSGPATNPSLDLHAELKDGDAIVDLRISGTAEKPVMDLSSDTYADKSQILTFLITGQSPDSLSAEQGQAALTAALGRLLLDSVLGGASVGSFSIDPDGNIRIGTPTLAHNLVADLIIPVRREIGENSFELDGELQITRRFVVGFNVGDIASEANLFYELRF